MALSSTWIVFASAMLVLSGTWNSLVSKSTASIVSPGLHNESEKVCKEIWRGKERVSDLKEKSVCRGTVALREPAPAPFRNPLWQVLAMFVGMTVNIPIYYATSSSKSADIPLTAIYSFLAPTVFSMLVSLVQEMFQEFRLSAGR